MKPEPLKMLVPMHQMIYLLARDQGYDRESLAKKLGRTPKHVDRLTAGDPKLKLDDIAAAFLALGTHVHFATTKVKENK